MGLYLGSTDISGASFKLGSSDVSALYLGSTELYPDAVTSTMWRYDVGSIVADHHPRVARIDFYDSISAAWVNLITYAADNCADSGGIPCGDSGYCDTSGVIDKTFGSAIAVTGCRFYVSYGGGFRSANVQILQSPDGGANYYPVWNTVAAAAACGEVELTLTAA